VLRSSERPDMNPNTGEIVEIPEGELEEIEKAFEAKVEEVREAAAEGSEGAAKVMRALGMDPSPALVPIPPEELDRVRRMSKERRRAWAKSQLERRVRRKRERAARKAGRKSRSR
jgi:hypothetical protein